jgi:hydroxyacylglutathione hydrolase
MINIKNFVFNELGVNCYVLYEDKGESVIVDPGCSNEKMFSELTGYIKRKELNPRLIINTHGHFDHLYGNSFVKKEYGCPLLIHEADLLLLKSATQQASLFGLKTWESPLPDRFVNEGEIINFGTSVLKVIWLPGHSPGSICLYSEEDLMLISGDVLFSGSVGRTDLFGGNHEQLITGIKSKLMILPSETVVYPGHGIMTTIGQERDTNPFLN